MKPQTHTRALLTPPPPALVPWRTVCFCLLIYFEIKTKKPAPSGAASAAETGLKELWFLCGLSTEYLLTESKQLTTTCGLARLLRAISAHSVSKEK